MGFMTFARKKGAALSPRKSPRKSPRVSPSESEREQRKAGAITRAIRDHSLSSMIDVIIEIQVVMKEIKILKTGKHPEEGETLQRTKSEETKIGAMRKKLTKFEASAYRKYQSIGLLEYQQCIAEKRQEFEKTLNKEKRIRAALLKTVQKENDEKQVKEAMKGVNTMSKLRFLQKVILVQSNYRAMAARNQYKKRVAAAKLIQKTFRAYRVWSKATAAAIRLQAEQRRILSEKQAKQRMRAIILLQRFIVARLKRRKEARERVKANFAKNMKNSAASRFFKARHSAVNFLAWAKYTRIIRKGKKVVVGCMDRWITQRLAYAFKVWWLTSRRTYEVKTVRGVQVVVENKGANMSCVQISYKQNFERLTNAKKPSIHFERGTWKSMALIDPTKPLGPKYQDMERQQEMGRRKMSDAPLMSSLSSPAVNIGMRKEEIQYRKTPENWCFHTNMAKTKANHFKSGLNINDKIILSHSAHTPISRLIAEQNNRAREHKNLLVNLTEFRAKAKYSRGF